MTASFRPAASLAAALIFALFAGCAGADDPPDPNASHEGVADEEVTSYAGAVDADAEFLSLYAETNRFRYGHPRGFTFLPDGSAVLFLRAEGRSPRTQLYELDLESGDERVLLTAEQLLGADTEELTPEERARRERLRLTASGIARFTLSRDGTQLLVPQSGRLFLVARERIGQADAIRELTSDAGAAVDARFSPDGTKVAAVRGGDLYVTDLASGEETRLTTRANDDIEHGLAEFVAQEEMRRYRGFWWSPDGQTLAVQQTDHAGLERMHILDPTHPEREPTSFPYPRPGQANAVVRLGLVPAAGGDLRWIDWDRDAYPYLASVTWSSSGPLTILVQDREQHAERLLAVDEAGRTTELLREEDEAWINLDASVPRWLPNDAGFLWSSEREGEPRLELRNADGSLARELTGEGFGYDHVLGVTDDGATVWVEASPEPTESQVFRVNVADGEATQVSEGSGEHGGSLGERAGLWVEVTRSLTAATSYVVRRLDGEEVAAVDSAAVDAPAQPNVTLETVGRREWRTAVVRPRDVDENKKYPVLLHVYAGPGHRMVGSTRARYLLPQWMADQGFVVVMIDGRGTPGRGREWERAIDLDLIGAPLEDQVEALQQLGDLHPELDMDRVGVWGWSFGGYFSAMAVLQRPDIFRAGVAGAPVSEWRDYDTHYTERFLGLPEEEGTEGAYHVSSVLTYAAEVVPAEDHRPLLVIHGTADDNVYFSHALKLQDAALRAGRPCDLLTLSGQTHMVPDRVLNAQRYTRMMQFFESHLRR